ncbi:MAG: phosphoribosylanthranilate isomerase [Acidobacteria bacterium]|nr:phosphoribosylanthranilate isomerase [Acidobacteriota bacterium]
MRIKICGFTRVDDLLAAARLNVDAAGFVLWPGSPRHVDLTHLAELTRALPPFMTAVGVFVDPSREDVLAARAAGIQVAQITGRVPSGLQGELTVLPVVHVREDGNGITPEVDGNGAVVVDAFDPIRRGGTGRTVNWTHVRAVSTMRPVVLAGGLTPENVRQAMREARPFAVDVSSGVEQAPGIKSADRMAAFVAAVKAGA